MRGLKAAISVLCIVAAVTGCSSSGNDKDAFCEKLPNVRDVSSILNDFSTTPPDQLADKFKEGLSGYRELERSAPRTIRADVAKVADTVELILEIVERNSDDLAKIRTELAAKAATLASAGKSGAAVAKYASDECGLSLQSGEGG